MSGGAKQSKSEKQMNRTQAALMQQQLSVLQNMQHQQDLLAPIMYKNLGLTPKYDTEGKLTGFEESAGATEANALKQEIDLGLLRRSKAALEGTLPVSPGLERELGEQERTLRETLRSNLGEGFETSTPGIEALARQKQSALELRDAARMGQLSLGEQLSMARSGFNAGNLVAGPSGALQFSGLPLSSLSQVLGGTNQGISALAAQRQSMARPSRASGALAGASLGASLGSVIPGVGTAIGAGVGALGGLFLSR